MFILWGSAISCHANPQAVSCVNIIYHMLANCLQDVSSDTTLLLQTNLILSDGQQKVCELYHHLLARWLQEKQFVSDNALVLNLIHMAHRQ